MSILHKSIKTKQFLGRTMKKPKFLNKLTIIDILIIIFIIGAVGFAIYHMADDNSSNASAISYDISTENKIIEGYTTYYQKGNKITANLVGTKSNTGEKVKLSGPVLWAGEIEKESPNILMENDGKRILAGFYKDSPNVDVYIDQLSLETDGDKYGNITDFSASPKKIKRFNDLVSKIPNGTEYEISTSLAIDNLDSIKYQQLINALNKNKKPCMVLEGKNNVIKINRANKEDLEIADNVIEEFDGQTSEIQIRIYNCSNDDSIDIQSAYNVLSIGKTTS